MLAARLCGISVVFFFFFFFFYFLLFLGDALKQNEIPFKRAINLIKPNYKKKKKKRGNSTKTRFPNNGMNKKYGSGEMKEENRVSILA